MDFDIGIATEVCDVIAETPKGLKHILASDDRFPFKREWYEWLKESEDLRNLYARAKELQAEVLFEECMDISDDSSGDTKLIGEGATKREVCDSEFVQRSRLRIDTRRWMLGKLNPKKYGDKITTEHTGGITVVSMDATDEAL